MKIHRSDLFIGIATLLASSLLAVSGAGAAEGAGDDERAVWKAAAAAMAQEATRARPPKTLYYKSDFAEASLMVSFAKDDLAKDFCGLSGQAADAMAAELKAINSEAIEFDESIGEGGNLNLVRKKDPRRYYIALSRVVFDATRERAWLAVDLYKIAGAVIRMDKVDGAWRKAAECGGWLTLQ